VTKNNNNVLICYSTERRLSEYSPLGKLIHRINLPPVLQQPCCAVALDARLWLVGHGGGAGSSALHRVCRVDGRCCQVG